MFENVDNESDGSQVRAFDVQQVAPFLRWVLSQEGGAVILNPTGLVRELRGLVEEIAAVYRQEAPR